MPRVSEKSDRIEQAKAKPGLFESLRKAIAPKARHVKAPHHALACVEAAVTKPFDEGLQIEKKLFAELENSDEAKALRYAFFAEREAAKIPGAEQPQQTGRREHGCGHRRRDHGKRHRHLLRRLRYAGEGAREHTPKRWTKGCSAFATPTRQE